MNCSVCHKPVSEHRDGLMCCPFCGGPARLLQDAVDTYSVECASYECRVDILRGWLGFEDAAQVAAIWNRRASGWIACEDRMPGRGEAVAVCDGSRVKDGYLDPYGDGWEADGSHWSTRTFCHWQPRPEPCRESE